MVKERSFRSRSLRLRRSPLTSTLDLLCFKKKEKYGTVGADKPRAKTSREKIWAERFLLAPMPSRLAPFAAQMKACSQVGVEFTTFFFQVVLLSLFLARYAVNTKLGMNTAG